MKTFVSSNKSVAVVETDVSPVSKLKKILVSSNVVAIKMELKENWRKFKV